MKKTAENDNNFEIREKHLASTVQGVFPAGFEESLQENIQRFENMNLDYALVNDFDIFSDDLAWIAEDFCKDGLFSSPYAEKIASVIKGENENLDIHRIFNERHPEFCDAHVCENIETVRDFDGRLHEIKTAKSTVVFPLAEKVKKKP